VYVIRRIAAEERGAVVAWVVLWVPLLIVIATFVIDVGNWWTHRRHLQNQVDAGALAAGAAYSLPACQTDSALQDDISDEAMSYSGTTRRIAAGNSPTTRNPQVSNSANVFVTINSTSYWDGPSAGVAPDYSDGGGPCYTHTNDIKGFWTDVKATERNLPWLIPFAGSIVPRIQARARVAVKKAIIFTNALPLAVPDVNPTGVWGQFVDECAGSNLGAKFPLTRPDPNQQDLWGGSTLAPVTLPAPSGTCGANGKVGIRIIMSGGQNQNCGQALVECYDSGSANGLFMTRVWDPPAGAAADPGAWTAGNPTTTFLPYIKDVELDYPATPACSGYFTYVNCTATVAVTMEKGIGPNSFNVGTFNVLEVAYPGGTANLTDPDGDSTYTANVPFTTAGPYPITVDYHWQLRQNGVTWRGIACASGGSNNCEVPSNGTNSFGVVHRGFRASGARSGPISQLEVRRSNTTLLENAQSGFTDTLSVALRVSGTLVPHYRQTCPTNTPNCDPLVNLRVTDGSQTQALDCDDTIPNLRDEIAQGCHRLYKINDGSDPNWNPCPQPTSFNRAEPWGCVATQTGATIGQFADGMNTRLGNQSSCVNDNNWRFIDQPDNDLNPLKNQNDPRAIKLYLVPFGAFSGSGNQNYPVTNVGLFYVTGYGGQGSNQDPCRLNPYHGDPASPGDMLGHFFKRVGINDDELIPIDEACIANSITPCVAVLVD
jgi:hypothetical protein